jgi:hypothetical protein
MDDSPGQMRVPSHRDRRFRMNVADFGCMSGILDHYPRRVGHDPRYRSHNAGFAQFRPAFLPSFAITRGLERMPGKRSPTRKLTKVLRLRFATGLGHVKIARAIALSKRRSTSVSVRGGAGAVLAARRI